MSYKDKVAASMRVFTVDQAIAERQAILDKVGDADRFRRRGQNFELGAEETVLYDQLTTLDHLLALHDEHSAQQKPEASKRQQTRDAQLLRRLKGAVSDIEVAQTDLTLAIRKRDNIIAELITRGVEYSTIAEHTAMSNVSLTMIKAMSQSANPIQVT